MDFKQMVDALTSHIALYSSSASSAAANPNPRNGIVRWLSTLSVAQRQSHLIILDPPFLKILLQMHSRILASGPSLFFILPDLPSSSDASLPTLCSRRSRGLLLRSQDSDEGARTVFASLRLFGSKEGRDECEIDTAVVSEELVADLGRFMEVMDGVSNGGFLRGEVEGMGSAWAEAKWLKEKGYYSLESFVVNRIEMALRLSWREWNGEKKQKGVKVKGSSGVGAGVAANIYWRKKGCVDWFLGLDPGVRKRMCLTFFSMGAKTLVKESLKSSDDFSKFGMCFSKALPSLPYKYDSHSSFKRRNPLHCQKDFTFSLHAMSKSFSGNSRLSACLRDLIVLQQIADMLLICQSNELGADTIFFSTLTSVETISDCILRRFRGFLMVVSSDCFEFELTRDTSMNTPKKKPEQKSSISSHSQRGKNKCHKRVNPAKKSQKNPAIESNKIKHNPHKKECLVPTISAQDCGPPKVIVCETICNALTCAQYSQSLSSGHSDINCSQFEGSAVPNKKEGATELVDDTTCIRKKRGARRGFGSKNTSMRKTTSKAGKSALVTHATSVREVESVCIDKLASSMSTSIMVQVNQPSQQISANADNEPKTIFDKEVNNDSVVECSTSLFVKNHHTSDECYQILDQPLASGASSSVCISSENTRDSNLVRKSSPAMREVTGSNFRDTVTLDMSTSDDTNTATSGPAMPVCECDVCFGTEVVIRDGSGSVTDNVLQTIDPPILFGEVIYDGHSISQTKDTSCHTCTEATTAGITSSEHPSVVSLHYQVSDSNNLPATTDSLHLDAGYNQPNHLHQSLFPGRPQVRNTTESECGHNMPSVTSMSLDWPPLVRSCRRLSQPGISNYGPVYNSKLQSTLCTGITNSGMQFKGLYSDNEQRLFGDVDLSGFQNQNASEMVDESERRWMSDEETDMQTISGDYNKYFGGGVMYWNTSDNSGTGFSRPPSHSSEDGSWAWYDADLNRAIDDMVGLPAPYSVNGMSSPTAASFCSPFESLGPGQQSLSYVISGNDVSALDSQAADLSEESVSGTLNTSTCSSNEGIKGDSLPYPILRPIIIPSLSRKSSRSEFKLSCDHRSPCLPSSRRDPQLKRPPSPVVLCVPHAPRVAPPSVGESRKHKGFQVVRSGSSSPRNWGMRNWYHEEINNDDVRHCVDIPEVVWAPWGDKSLSGNAMMQDIPGSLLQDRLIAISQLGRDQEHPDVAFPVQPSEPVNCPWKTSLSRMQSFLHEEISSFCKKVATENHAKKPFINWAVKRVARSLLVLWPRSRTNLFGSNATGLALPTSDVDLVVCLPPVRNLEPIKEAGILEGRNGIKETCLQHAARYLANQDWVKNDSLKIIENTAIPLIMLVVEVPIDFIGSGANIPTSQPLDTLSAESIDTSNLLQSRPSTFGETSTLTEDTNSHVRPIRLDISFKSPSHTGLQTTELVRELTKQFPASIPLSLILKQFLADRSLDHSYSGGLSSYCLVLLITRFLQHECHLGRPLNQNLGVLLMDFLYFYGNVFDPRQMRISIQGSGLYMTRERGQSIDPIHIDDPLCPMNNVGRNCFRIHQCIKAFADAYSALESQIVHFSNNPDSRMCTFKLLPKIIPSINHQE